MNKNLVPELPKGYFFRVEERHITNAWGTKYPKLIVGLHKKHLLWSWRMYHQSLDTDADQDDIVGTMCLLARKLRELTSEQKRLSSLVGDYPPKTIQSKD